MSKKSKLAEKPARTPDAFEVQKTVKIEKYIESVQKGQSEHGKSLLFFLLLKDLFESVEPQFAENYSRGIEKFVKSKEKDIIIKGRLDAFYGNLIIEFEKDLSKTLVEAKEQLKRYASCLWQESMGRRIPYICIATDGLQFNIYTPKIKNESEKVTPENVILEESEQINLFKAKPLEVYFFLDRYIVRKEIRHPTTEEFIKDFGPQSVAFRFVYSELESVWQKVKNKSSYQVVFENWEKYLKIAYGTAVTEKQLFIKHTYLASLSKILAWQRLAEKRSSSFKELKEVLAGDYFKKINIINFLEEDFFSWMVRDEAWLECKESIQKLFNQLLGYNLRELSEDVLKGLYQELVDPQTRHDLGEYYTPDWLAEKIVCKTLKENPKASVLDPACGSGTFLYMAIKYKAEVLGKGKVSTLDHIVSSVVGIDIHPLAVIVAKTNYLLALGDLLSKRKSSLVIPVYLADSIKIPVLNGQRQMYLHEKGKNLPVKLLEKEAYIPEALFSDRNLYDQAIEEVLTYAQVCVKKKENCNLEEFTKFIKRRFPKLRSVEAIQTIFHLAEILKELIEEDRDTIWSFVLKNIYKPIFLQRKFDLIVGNPPWLSYRYIEKGEYQNFIKKQVKDYWLSRKGRVENISNMELATLFFVKTLDLYLTPNGEIAFVMPRSIFTADHHHHFREADLQIQFGFKKIWDLENVNPLFNIPSCVVFGQKNTKTDYRIKCDVLSGKLDSKNEKLINADEKLQIESRKLDLKKRGGRSYWTTTEESFFIFSNKPSPYGKLFKRGADIIPRSFWFVEPKSPRFGLDTARPYVQTDQRAIKTAKEKFKNVFLEGNIEKEFLHATLLSTDLVPFGRLPFRLIVLPIEKRVGGFRMVDQIEAKEKGLFDLEKWLSKAEFEWTRLKGEKGEKITAGGWLNYRNKLTNQKKSKFKVLYPTSATNLFGVMIDCKKNPGITINGLKILTNGFVIESTAYYFETDNRNEACYLTAFLNSSILNQALKPLQARGLFGPRHIHKKVWEFPIPRFNPKNLQHQNLVKIGEKTTAKVKRFLKGERLVTSIGRLRRDIKKYLENELKEIDNIARNILEKEE